MITYVNEKNAEKYDKLFQAASLATGKEINNIESYLANLGELEAIAPKFVRLPVDEDVFEIKADERVISIPKDSFAKNGIGVVGDELAEIVYFKINRYFDVVDLGASDKEIYIQWTNAAKESNLSAAYAVDLESDPDYIYFGWVLTNSITHAAGNILFNVRIVGRDIDENGNEVLGYSFSTQTAQVAVKPALNLDVLNLKAENASELVKSRILKKNIAHAPKIVLQLEEKAASGEEVKAIVEAAEEGDKIYAKAFKGNDAYGSEAYTLIEANAEGKYEYSITIDSTGEYYITFLSVLEMVDMKDAAGNKLEYHTTSAKVKTQLCHVPSPIKVEIIENLKERQIIGKESAKMIVSQPEGQLSVVIKKADSKDGEYIELSKEAAEQIAIISALEDGKAQVALSPEEVGFYQVKVNNTLNKEMVDGEFSGICRVTKPAKVDAVKLTAKTKEGEEIILKSNKVNYLEGMKLVANVVTNDGSDALHYQWFIVKGQEDPEDPEEMIDLELAGQVGAELQLPVKVVNPETGEAMSYTTSAYYVKVINELNGDFTEEAKKSSNTITVQ